MYSTPHPIVKQELWFIAEIERLTKLKWDIENKAPELRSRDDSLLLTYVPDTINKYKKLMKEL